MDMFNKKIWAEGSQLYSQQKNTKASDFVTVRNSATQDILRILCNPAHKYQSILLYGAPGTGKTRCALGMMDALIETLDTPLHIHQSPIYILSFNSKVFTNELRSNPDHGISPRYNIHQDDQTTSTERSIKHIMGYFTKMGYKEFANEIFSGSQQEKNNVFMSRYESWGPELEEKRLNGEITVKMSFVESLRGATLICDEIHQVHALGTMNRSGLAISLVTQLVPDIKLIVLDATPVARTVVEIVSVVNLLLYKNYKIADLFDIDNTIPHTKPILTDIITELGNRTFILTQPVASSCPDVLIEGSSLTDKYPNIPPINYDECPIGPQQERLINSFVKMPIEQRAAENCPVISGTEILYGGNVLSRTLKQHLPTVDSMITVSSKLKRLYELLINYNYLWDNGQILIFTTFIIFPGARLIGHFLDILGLVKYGSTTSSQGKLCSICKGPHKHSSTHRHTFVYYTELNRELNETDFTDLYNTFNSDDNADGKIIKLVVGTPCINVSVTFRNTNKLIVFDSTTAIPLLIQLIGRPVRPHTITSSEIEQVVHVHNFIATRKTVQTREILKEERKHHKYLHIQKLMNTLLSSSSSLTYITEIQPPMKFVDATARCSRKKFLNHIDIEKYIKYTFLKQLDVPAATDVPLYNDTILPRRLSIASRFIKTMLLAHGSISLQQLYNDAQTMQSFLIYNIKSIRIEEFGLAARLMSNTGQILTEPYLETIISSELTGIQQKRLAELLLFDETSPWILDPYQSLLRIVFEGGQLYLVANNLVHYHPKYTKVLNYTDFYESEVFTLQKKVLSINDSIENIKTALERLDSTFSFISVFWHISIQDLKMLLCEIVLNGLTNLPESFQVLVDFMIMIRVLIPASDVDKVAPGQFVGPYPIGQVSGILFGYDGIQLIALSHELKVQFEFHTEAETQIKLIEKDDKCHLILRVGQPDSSISDKRRARKGVNIKNATMALLDERLKLGKSKFARTIREETKNVYDNNAYKHALLDIAYKLQQQNPNIRFFAFMIGMPGKTS